MLCDWLKMKFYCKKIYLFNCFKLIKKKKLMYLKLIYLGNVNYFLLPKNILVYKKNNFVYFFGLFIYKSIINTLCSILYDSIILNMQKYRLYFYVNGHNCYLEICKNFLLFYLGYTCPIVYKLPNKFFGGFSMNSLTDLDFFIEGFNKKKLSQIIVDLKKIRMFDVYGGKGIFLSREIFKKHKTKKEIKKFAN